jgi:hypothetical protein
MSRSGYCDDIDDNWSHICWRGAVASALRGKRGQAFLLELAAAMDAMPVKRLVTEELQADGEFCTLGVVGNARGLDMTVIDPDDAEVVADKLGLASAMVREIVYENDEYSGAYQWQSDGSRAFVRETPEQRWVRMRKWVDDQIKQVQP